jgi:hypothetical protein
MPATQSRNKPAGQSGCRRGDLNPQGHTPTRPSTVRVYQFRHADVEGKYNRRRRDRSLCLGDRCADTLSVGAEVRLAVDLLARAAVPLQGKLQPRPAPAILVASHEPHRLG